MSYTIRYRDPLFSGEDSGLMWNGKMVAFDVETSGVHIHTDEPYGLSMSGDGHRSVYATMDEQWILDLLADESILKIAHNAKYDRAMLAKGGPLVNNLACTQVAAHLLEWETLALKALSGIFLNREVKAFKDLTTAPNEMSFDEWADYSCPHAMSTYDLWVILEHKMKRLGLDKPFWNIAMPFLPVISDMEIAGVGVDTDYLGVLGVEFDKKIGYMTGALDELSGMHGMNHNSPDQVAYLLYNVLGLPAGRYTGSIEKSRPSVDKRYIETIKHMHKYIPLYLAYKELKVLKSSYVNSLLKRVVDGRVYGSFNQTRTRTGRLSSSDPNLQKIPQRTKTGKRIRQAFIAREGNMLVKSDWDQLELRDVADWSQDPNMLQVFREGRDPHTETAIRMYGDAIYRFKGKTANFQIVYGGGTPQERAALKKAYPRIFQWVQEAGLQAQIDCYVRTAGGRIRTIDELDPDNPSWVIKHGKREAISTIVQGSSFEEVEKGMTRAWKIVRHTDADAVLQVHDEVVHEVPINQVNDLIDTLQETLPTDELSLPLTVSIEVGKNWGQMTKLERGEKWEPALTAT